MGKPRGPRDVCPKCGRHAPHERLAAEPGENPFLRKWRCLLCGDEHAFCEIRFNTPEEKAVRKAEKYEYRRKWYRENSEHAKRYSREYVRLHGYNQKMRLRYKTDAEFRRKKNEQGKAWAEKNSEKRREIALTYYYRNRDVCSLRCKRYRLKRYREERGKNGSQAGA
jgi:hypothetical protein